MPDSHDIVIAEAKDRAGASLFPVIPSPDRTEGATATRVCLISLSGELFAIDLRHIREVFEVDSVTPVPGMPRALAGVVNLRGMVVPLLDLRAMLGLSVTGPVPKFGVVIQHGSHQMGVLVDEVPEIRTVYTDEFLAAPATGAIEKPFVSSILRVEDRMSGVVEVPTLLAYVQSER
ncbi:MAG: purine-binding chemotaxis protein CheW [Nitrospirae bacterium]|nr:MAG: purine-binding chemotaxis protein CheW [Nitrospirota bacterium]